MQQHSTYVYIFDFARGQTLTCKIKLHSVRKATSAPMLVQHPLLPSLTHPSSAMMLVQHPLLPPLTHPSSAMMLVHIPHSLPLTHTTPLLEGCVLSETEQEGINNMFESDSSGFRRQLRPLVFL